MALVPAGGMGIGPMRDAGTIRPMFSWRKKLAIDQQALLAALTAVPEENTMGSKSAALELTKISVDMKVLIEQMREQVQNIE